MPRFPRLLSGGPLDVALVAPFAAGDIAEATSVGRVTGATERRLEKARKRTGIDFPGMHAERKKYAPAGPVSSIGGQAVGIGGGALGAALGSAVPYGGTLVGGLGGYVAGEAVGRKLLAPIDKAFFQKQLARTAKIREYLERYRGA